jgi:hypothetical protein
MNKVNSNDDSNVIKSIYDGTGSERFYGIVVDSNDDIICVGYTRSEGVVNSDALVVKYSGSDLSVLDKTVYNGSGISFFHRVTIDDNDDIICIGYTRSERVVITDTLIVKYSGSDLSILDSKSYDDTDTAYFRGVITNHDNDIICIGYSRDGITNTYDAFIIKYSGNDLSILGRNLYSTTGNDCFFGVVVDSNNDIICAGYTEHANTGSDDTLIVKYHGSDLNTLDSKVYSGDRDESFHGVVVDSNDNIICVGNTCSKDDDNHEALVVKFDSSDLSVSSRKVYSGTGCDTLYGIIIDSNDDIICVGYTCSERVSSNPMVVKFSSSDLDILVREVYGNSDHLESVVIDPDGDVICIGTTTSDGDAKAYVTKFRSRT